MSPSPYCNNLKKDDIVLVLPEKRPAKVTANPRDTARSVRVQVQGGGERRVDILNLRLVVDGKPEDVPPCEGTPAEPDRAERAPRTQVCISQSAVDTLRNKRKELVTDMAALEQRFKAMKDEIERIDRAILCLDPTPPHVQITEISVPRS